MSHQLRKQHLSGAIYSANFLGINDRLYARSTVDKRHIHMRLGDNILAFEVII